MFSLGAGVDHILNDDLLPKQVPIVRVVDKNLTARMVEYTVLHCLSLTREQVELAACQSRAEWCTKTPITTSDVRVGIMGIGVLGGEVAKHLIELGFRVSGWSKSKKQITFVTTYVGQGELDRFLSESDILIVLLPGTPAMNGMINLDLLSKLPHDGPVGAPSLISVGRGSVQVDRDILYALNTGVLGRAILDVFEQEPLPRDSLFWPHPQVVVTPHCAAVTDPRTIVSSIIADIGKIEAGSLPDNIVDVVRGY